MAWWNFSKKTQRPGLDMKFKVGEILPWKGIAFRIKEVLYDEIVLKPESMTAKEYKKRKGG